MGCIDQARLTPDRRRRGLFGFAKEGGVQGALYGQTVSGKVEESLAVFHIVQPGGNACQRFAERQEIDVILLYIKQEFFPAQASVHQRADEVQLENLLIDGLRCLSGLFAPFHVHTPWHTPEF